MTMLEKLRKERPEFIGEQYPGGVAICPEDIGLPQPKDCAAIRNGYRIDKDSCIRCWDREMEGTKT